MNAKQRRTLRRKTKLKVTFVESNQGSIREYMNTWVSQANGGAGGSSDRHQGKTGLWYPKELLDEHGQPLPDISSPVEMHISFDFKAHEQSTQEKLA